MKPFTKYQEFITNHSNYNFLPLLLKQKWVQVSKNGINPRLIFWEEKKKELIEKNILSSDCQRVNVARYLHPTKIHTCNICNKELSIYYIYPNKTTIKWLNKSFNKDYDWNEWKTIFELYNDIEHDNKKELFDNYFKTDINSLKELCYNDKYTGKKLSPGVMANPPDRLDGFHSYNNCCRPTADKGRSDENMKSYNRDRRAYEYYSDGNILLSNLLMGKLNSIKHKCFMCNKENNMTGDHIGPISLGFVHDPINFQACCSSCNSSKNNRLTQNDVNKLLSLEQNGEKIVSWWAKKCWNKFKNSDIKTLQSELNNNSKKFLEIIEWLKINKKNILENFIENNSYTDKNVYLIDNIEIDDLGNIKFNKSEKISNKKTKEKQENRTLEVLLEKNTKTNRKTKIILTDLDISLLDKITVDNFSFTINKIL